MQYMFILLEYYGGDMIFLGHILFFERTLDQLLTGVFYVSCLSQKYIHV